MGLETGTKFSDLVAANPPGTDLRSTADDHLRLIKAVLKARTQRMPGSGEVETELTIATGAIVPIMGVHSVDTETDAASDDLDTITATNFTSGMFLWLRANHTDRSVVLKDNTGNIQLTGNRDITLDENTRYVLLRYDGTNWLDWLLSQSDLRILNDLTVDNDVTVANDILLTGGLHIAEGSTQGDPAVTSMIAYAKIKGATNALYLKDGDGNVHRLGGAFEALSDADKTLTMEDAGYHTLTPTVLRTVTLPTTDVPAGWEVTIKNEANDAPTLAYDGQTSNFSLGEIITGGTSKARAILVSQSDSGTTGTLTLRAEQGRFVNDDALTGSASSGNGDATGATTSTDIKIVPSDAASEYYLRGKEWITLRALKDVPTSAGDWEKVAGSERLWFIEKTQTFNVPLAIHKLHARVIGGGGGGGAGATNNAWGGAGGGSAGAEAKADLNVTPDGDITATIGAGGGSATNGNNSTFSTLTGTAGKKGTNHNGTAGKPGGTGVLSVGGDTRMRSESGNLGATGISTVNVAGGVGGATSVGGGGTVDINTNGTSAFANTGAGGGGAAGSKSTGGSGGSGIIILSF